MYSNIFKKHNFDMVIITMMTPGMSAFNPVERRMAPLSKQLSGIVLDHEHFGSHLQNNKTIDIDLEKDNFAFAGKTLADI